MAATVRVQAGAAVAERSDRPSAHVRTLVGRGVRAALRRAQIGDAEISITLLDDAEITTMNRDFLAHEGPTDVISFALYEDGETPVGDVYVGLDQAQRQAETAGIPLEEELVRLAVHGTLHVLGHDHPEGEDRLHSEMWHVQEEIVDGVIDR